MGKYKINFCGIIAKLIDDNYIEIMKKSVFSLLILSLVAGLYAQPKIDVSKLVFDGISQSTKASFEKDLVMIFGKLPAEVSYSTDLADFIISGSVLNFEAKKMCRYDFMLSNSKGKELSSIAGMVYSSELENGTLPIRLIQKFGPSIDEKYADNRKADSEWYKLLGKQVEQSAKVIKAKFYADSEVIAFDIQTRMQEIVQAEIPDSGNIKVISDFYDSQAEKWKLVIADLNDFVRKYGIILVQDLSNVDYRISGERIYATYTPGIKVVYNKNVMDTIRDFYSKWDNFYTNPDYKDMSSVLVPIKAGIRFNGSTTIKVYTDLYVEDQEGYPVINVFNNKEKTQLDFTGNFKDTYKNRMRQSKYYEEGRLFKVEYVYNKKTMPDDLTVKNVKFSDAYIMEGSKIKIVSPVLTVSEWEDLLDAFERQ